MGHRINQNVNPFGRNGPRTPPAGRTNLWPRHSSITMRRSSFPFARRGAPGPRRGPLRLVGHARCLLFHCLDDLSGMSYRQSEPHMLCVVSLRVGSSLSFSSRSYPPFRDRPWRVFDTLSAIRVNYEHRRVADQGNPHSRSLREVASFNAPSNRLLLSWFDGNTLCRGQRSHAAWRLSLGFRVPEVVVGSIVCGGRQELLLAQVFG